VVKLMDVAPVLQLVVLGPLPARPLLLQIETSTTRYQRLSRLGCKRVFRKVPSFGIGGSLNDLGSLIP
jgi:hypothetical protein